MEFYKVVAVGCPCGGKTYHLISNSNETVENGGQLLFMCHDCGTVYRVCDEHRKIKPVHFDCTMEWPDRPDQN